MISGKNLGKILLEVADNITLNSDRTFNVQLEKGRINIHNALINFNILITIILTIQRLSKIHTNIFILQQ